MGPLVDNEGKKDGVSLGLILIAFALFLLPKSKSYGQIALYMLLLGLGGGIIVTAANAVVNDMGSAALFNFINLFFGLGGLATPFISANLLGNNSQRLCYLTAILTVVTLAASAAAPIPGPTGERGFQFSQAGSLVGSRRCGCWRCCCSSMFRARWVCGTGWRATSSRRAFRNRRR